MKTSELTGKALNAAVAVAQGWELDLTSISPIWKHDNGLHIAMYYQPSTEWKQGGPIIQENNISTEHNGVNEWLAGMESAISDYAPEGYALITGNTILQAAMRVFVLSKLGDTVELPKGLKL